MKHLFALIFGLFSLVPLTTFAAYTELEPPTEIIFGPDHTHYEKVLVPKPDATHVFVACITRDGQPLHPEATVEISLKYKDSTHKEVIRKEVIGHSVYLPIKDKEEPITFVLAAPPAAQEHGIICHVGWVRESPKLNPSN